jgi:hypothetical protein
MTKCLRSVATWTFAAMVIAASGCEQPAPGATTGQVSSAMTQDEVLPTGGVCTPTGAHAKHGFTSCATCHACAGALQFDPAGPAVSASTPNPTFDATAKTCSSVACHGVPAGTFSFYFPDGAGDPQLNTVSYGGANSTTPSWYTSGAAGCTACHGNPPQNYVWHGSHPGGNQCELCHPDAVSVNGVATGLSTATNCGPTRTTPCASFHANGTVDVTATFKTTCLGCH